MLLDVHQHQNKPGTLWHPEPAQFTLYFVNHHPNQIVYISLPIIKCLLPKLLKAIPSHIKCYFEHEKIRYAA